MTLDSTSLGSLEALEEDWPGGVGGLESRLYLPGPVEVGAGIWVVTCVGGMIGEIPVEGRLFEVVVEGAFGL
mgnify:FL=1